MREMVDDCGMKIGIVETVAKDGTGIREAFVFAVRLALDRVRELMRLGLLTTGRPDIDSADDLLAEMREQEGSTLDLAAEMKLAYTRLADLRSGSDLQSGSLAAQALDQAMRGERDAAAPAADALRASVVAREPHRPRGPVSVPPSPAASSAIPAATAAPTRTTHGSSAIPPALPSERVASGLVWPPVDGRVILQEVASSAVNLRRLEDGAWYGRIGNRWHVRAPADAVYESIEQGRPALIALARAYATKCREDSVERCVALASDGRGRVRLWRIKRIAN
jgi:hypothetical protein